jgi:hypothetical protein
MRLLSITQEGEGAGAGAGARAMMSGPPVNDNNKTAVPFKFPFIVLLHGLGTFFNFNPCRLLQLQSSSPTSSLVDFNFNPHRLQLQSSLPTSILVANFNPRRQLQPSSPSTSTLVAFQFPNPIAFPFPPLLLDARSVLDAAAAR